MNIVNSRLKVVEEESSVADVKKELAQPDPTPEKGLAIVKGEVDADTRRNDRKSDSRNN